MEKTCSKCGKTKPIKDFNKVKSGKYGVRGECKICAQLYHKHRNAAVRRARWTPKKGTVFTAYLLGSPNKHKKHVGSPFVSLGRQKNDVTAIDQHGILCSLSVDKFYFIEIKKAPQ